VWRVWAWDGERLSWAVQAVRDTEDEARQLAEAMQHRNPRRRVRVQPAARTVLDIKPPVNNASREFRLGQAAVMSDRADTNKRYKSPG
jgi:hypothetical protein